MVRSMQMLMADMSNMAVERWPQSRLTNAQLTFDDPFGRGELIIRRRHFRLSAHESSKAVPSMARNKHDFPSITPHLSPR